MSDNNTHNYFMNYELKSQQREEEDDAFVFKKVIYAIKKAQRKLLDRDRVLKDKARCSRIEAEIKYLAEIVQVTKRQYEEQSP